MKMTRRRRKALRALLQEHPHLRYISDYHWQVPDGRWRWDTDAPGGVLVLRDQLHQATGGNGTQKKLVDYYLMRANQSLDAVGHFERALWYPDLKSGPPFGFAGLGQTRTVDALLDVQQHIRSSESLPLRDQDDAIGLERTVTVKERGEATIVQAVERVRARIDDEEYLLCRLDLFFADCIDTLRLDICCWEIDQADQVCNEILPAMAANAGVVLTPALGMIA